ncbi:uncharacterized protein C18orf63-like [Rhinatrema bivittatum]|uniref:uncharacterized protein C18orf63-like n=1 Tax=Rhinatrema bivittatum TaxID=194408 RepID=UPI00112611E4|nr:uncharacterized protein C18orf63-like [Rhinatrema bivittatum]
MDLNVSETQLCISLQVYTVRLPPSELGDFDISAGALKNFKCKKNAVILRHSISSNWCYVLPSMKMGQIVSISHVIPPDSPFLSYGNFQDHWNNLYGYVLPEDQGEDMIYCSVFFKLIGERLFTYPFSCIRSKPIQFFPRIDLDYVLNAFLSDLKSELPHLCGFPVKMTSKPCYAAKELTRPHTQDIQCRPANLTTKAICRVSLTQFPSANRSVSTWNSLACAAGHDYKMGPLINQSKTYSFTNLSQPLQGTHANATLNEETFIQSSHQVSLREASGLPSLASSSQGKQGSSIACSHGNYPAKIIPIFKSRLLQDNLMNTKAATGAKQRSTLLSSSATSSKIGKENTIPKSKAFNPDAPLIHKSAGDFPVRKTTSGAIALIEKPSSSNFTFLPSHQMEAPTYQSNPVFTNSGVRNTDDGTQIDINPPLATCISLQLQTLNLDRGLRKVVGMNFSAREKVFTANVNHPHCLEISCDAENVHMSTTKMVTPCLSQREQENHSGARTAKDLSVIHRSNLDSTACLPNIGVDDQEMSVSQMEFSTKSRGLHSQIRSSQKQIFAADDPLHHETLCKLGIKSKTTAREESRKRKQKEAFETEFKKSKTKLAIQDVDVENHAKNNQLSKLNNTTLQIWLKQHGIYVKSRDKKEELVSKIMQFISES